MKVAETGVDLGGIQLLKAEFDDGQWWEFRREINWGTSREIRKIVTTMEVGTRNLDLAHEAQMLRVLGSTEAWSFKLNITKSSIDRIADWRVREVLTYMVERQRAEGSSDEIKKVSGLRLFSKLRSLFSIRMRWFTKT